MSVGRLSPGTVVSRIWEIYRDQFIVLFSMAVLLYAVQFVIYLLVPAAVGIVLVLLFWALSILYQGMVVELVQDVQDGKRDHSVPQLLRSVDEVFWPLVAVSILFGIGVAIGFILLIIPGLILIVLWAVVAPVTVLERPGVFAAFRRSRELVRGNGWEVFGVIVIVFVIVFVASVLVGIAASGLGSVGRALVQWAVNAAFAPLAALAASVLYFALRATHGETAATTTPSPAPWQATEPAAGPTQATQPGPAPTQPTEPTQPSGPPPTQPTQPGPTPTEPPTEPSASPPSTPPPTTPPPTEPPTAPGPPPTTPPPTEPGPPPTEPPPTEPRTPPTEPGPPA